MDNNGANDEVKASALANHFQTVIALIMRELHKYNVAIACVSEVRQISHRRSALRHPVHDWVDAKWPDLLHVKTVALGILRYSLTGTNGRRSLVCCRFVMLFHGFPTH